MTVTIQIVLHTVDYTAREEDNFKKDRVYYCLGFNKIARLERGDYLYGSRSSPTQTQRRKRTHEQAHT